MKVQTTAPATPRPATPQSAAFGYRLSSDELHSGLDVHTLSLTSLPLELVSELIRLRRTWGGSTASESLALN
jgi:hypothetical protein